MALVLSGCKYSDVLTEHIEDPDMGVLDPDQPPIYENVPGAPPDPDHVETREAESDDLDDFEEALPNYDDESSTDATADRRRNDDRSQDEDSASEGGDGDGSGSKDESEGDSGDTGDDEGANDDLASSEVPEDANQQSGEGGASGTQTIADEEGTDDDVQTGTVAAVGEYATIAMMLAGPGGLVAADADWISSMRAHGAFQLQGDELESVQACWSGDGTAAGSCLVNDLVNKAKPDVVLWDGSSPALTNADRAALEAAGISVQQVPVLGQAHTEDANIKMAVAEVAEVLSVAGSVTYSPTIMRDAYFQYHDEALQAALEANGGYSYKSGYQGLYQASPTISASETNGRTSVAYIDGWLGLGVSSAVVHRAATAGATVISEYRDGLSFDTRDGVGLSVASSTDGYQLVDYYLQCAGLVNNAYDRDKPGDVGKPYALIAGTSDFSTGGRFARRSMGSALFYASGDSATAANWKLLGDADFPAVLVNGDADDDIAAKLLASAGKADGLYNVGHPYSVHVVPSGLEGSWSRGHVDSYLLAPWALSVRDAGALDAAGTFVEALYRDFYRCDNWSAAVRNWNSTYRTS